MSTKEKIQEEVDVLEQETFQHEIVLHNDDVNTFDHVIDSLVAVCDHTFEQAGTYQTCLVAYNNLPTCADTVCKTIIAKDSIRLVLPNVFTPNNDAYNDVFELQLTGASLVKELSVEIFNRWGKLVNSKQWQVATPSNNYQEFTLWEGKTTNGTIVPQGTYFYVLNYQTTNGTTEALKGSVTVFY